MSDVDRSRVDPAAIAAVKRFFFAVTIGDGEAVWDELGEQARAYVLNLAVRQGMDFELGSRLRHGQASPEEQAEYLANLVRGLQRDTEGIDLASLAYEAEVVEGGPTPADRVRVRYAVPLGLTLPARPRTPDGQATIPAGSVIVAREQGHWRIERLIPRPGQ